MAKQVGRWATLLPCLLLLVVVVMVVVLVLLRQSSETHVDVGQEGSEPVLPVFAGSGRLATLLLLLMLHCHVTELLLELVKGVAASSAAPAAAPTVRPAPVDQV